MPAQQQYSAPGEASGLAGSFDASKNYGFAPKGSNIKKSLADS
jgi:hypothetical protein